MKIKVKPEGRENIYIPDRESLKAWIKDKGWSAIHNFIPSGMAFIGADHNVEDVLKDITKGDKVGILIGPAQSNNLGHALSIIMKDRLEMYDIGRITEDDLEVEK